LPSVDTPCVRYKPTYTHSQREHYVQLSISQITQLIHNHST
jgi:hypothetical protein